MKDNLVTLKQLDHQLGSLKESSGFLSPKQGWVRTMRQALGITIKQLARRLQVNPSRIVKIETSEAEGGLTLRTMRSVAESLNCRFVYSFIPNSSLEEIVKDRARQVALTQVKRTSHTMDLEAQPINKQWFEDQVNYQAEELLRHSWKNLWEE